MKLETILQAAINDMASRKEKPFCGSAAKDSDEIDYCLEYAEPGYSNPKRGILFGNWNHYPKRLTSILKKAGYAIEWSDEWSQCQNCNRAIRTSPDSYGWRKYYVIYNDCEVICADCVKNDLDAYEEYLLNKHTHADTFDIDWSERGFTRINVDSYENGFHAHQTDKPSDIVKLLPKDCDYLFTIPVVSQFTLSFDCWIRSKNHD